MSPSSSTASDRSTYFLMDALRFVAAVTVVLHHVRSLMFVESRPDFSMAEKAFYFLTGFGHQGVIIFFVLSGFWITKSVATRVGEHGFWRGYLAARLSRLWIVLIPALLLGGLFDLIGRYVIEAPLYAVGNGSNAYKLPLNFEALTWLGNFGFFQSLAVPVVGSNGPLWSLAFEFWFYIWFPALLFLTRGKISAALVALVLGALYPQLVQGFACWLAGSALYFAAEKTRSRAFGKWRLGAILGAGASLMAVAMIAARLNRMSPALSDIALSVGFALALYASLAAKMRYGEWIRPFARYGAGASYSLYAIHFPLVLLAVALLQPARRSLSLEPLGLALAITALAILTGYVFSRVTEAHTDKLRVRLRRPGVSSGELSRR